MHASHLRAPADRSTVTVSPSARSSTAAGFEVLSVDPTAFVVDAERGTVRGGDEVAVDLDVDELLDALADDGVGDTPQPALAGLRVGGHDHIANPGVCDRLGRAVRHQDEGR